MSIRTTVFMLLISLFAVHTFIHAQNNSEPSMLGDRIVHHIQSQKPDWKYEKVQPIADSAAVMVQQWTLDKRSIRIAIISHKSMQDAATAMSKLANEGQLNERFQGLGDDGMMWGRGVVSFRKRNLTIDVSATNTNPTLDLNEAAKNTADERKLAKEFAVLAAEAIKDKQ
jgi:hypothetical protein